MMDVLVWSHLGSYEGRVTDGNHLKNTQQHCYLKSCSYSGSIATIIRDC
jgi:hypothetical protein